MPSETHNFPYDAYVTRHLIGRGCEKGKFFGAIHCQVRIICFLTSEARPSTNDALINVKKETESVLTRMKELEYTF